ncbi:MAG: prepilin-type N-terminal cleavage/methylation domain-containing protein [Phycisphaera sp.]|nr:prepilin-type N-terminal cleavage/methylation domain-containing protein [Phycisphaera sp.]
MPLNTTARSLRADNRGGFTIVELLVVVSIIVLLVSILMPWTKRAEEVAQNVKCMAQMRQIHVATFTGATDHYLQLPAVWTGGSFSGPGAWQKCWVGREIFPSWYQPAPAAYDGALLPYVRSDEAMRSLVRCPSLPIGRFRSGVGSNGFLDLTMVQAFAGAKYSMLPTTGRIENLDTGDQMGGVPMHLITEEEPSNGINSAFVDPGHTSVNRTGSWHFGGGNYIAVDGSASRLERPKNSPYGPRAEYWWGRSPSGNDIRISNTNDGKPGGALRYGWWNDQ